MTIEEQLNVISSYKQGIEVYVRSKYDNRDKDWKLILGEHIFDFYNNRYSIGKPKSWVETLCEEPDMNIALSKSINHLEDISPFNEFIVRVTTRVNDEVISEKEAIYLEDIYKLWNIAVQYGRSNKDSELITEETNIYKRRK